MQVSQVQRLQGEITIPGDKSISHRAVMFGSLAHGTTEITNFLQGADCLSTIDCYRRLGIEIDHTPERILIHGQGLHGLHAPTGDLYVGNSGTTMRLLTGILAAQAFPTTLDGDASIRKRPMKRVITPLSLMGASITGTHQSDCAPLQITGAPLHGIQYHSPIASAQVKSAILLAGLYADSKTSVTEPYLSRNHSEIMLNYFGAHVVTTDTTATIEPLPKLTARKIVVPGDISSAAYFIAAGLITPHSEILIRGVGINPTRDGILTIAKAMGGDITCLSIREDCGEPTADILVRSSMLHGVLIEGSVIPTLIDELPIIAIMAAFATGTTVIKDAAELKVKESNRIDVMVAGLTAMGATASATEDGMIIEGGSPLTGAVIDSHLDHRIAMSFAIAGLNATGTTQIKGDECIAISYPGFQRQLAQLEQHIG
ncbi:MAG: 3-phosphoshikimate 1-carboxyvinyltransferase [Lachnospiraceae bacterium]